MLDDDYPEDENDRSYTAGSEAENVEENDGFMLNGIGHDERSTTESSGRSTDEEEEGEGEGEEGRARRHRRRRYDEEDEDDSDYEVGA